MFTKSKIKIICLKAWLRTELLYAEMETIQERGIHVLEGDGEKYARKSGYLMFDFWTSEGCTKEKLKLLQKKIKSIQKYYDGIDKSIQKVKKQRKDINFSDNWIPMYLCVAIAKKLKNEGIEIFPREIDIDKMVSVFVSADTIDRRTKMAYWSLAKTILEDMKKN